MNSMILNADDLADNSNEPKELKLQDLDIWAEDEMREFIMEHHIDECCHICGCKLNIEHVDAKVRETEIRMAIVERGYIGDIEGVMCGDKISWVKMSNDSCVDSLKMMICIKWSPIRIDKIYYLKER